jgi:hypothetical protein
MEVDGAEDSLSAASPAAGEEVDSMIVDIGTATESKEPTVLDEGVKGSPNKLESTPGPKTAKAKNETRNSKNKTPKSGKKNRNAKPEMKTVSHTIHTLIKQRNSSQDAAAILAKSGGGGGISLSNYLQLLESEPLLFTLTNNLVGLALNGNSAPAFFDRLCQRYNIDCITVPPSADDNKTPEDIAGLLASKVLPLPVSLGHSLELEAEQRLVIVRLQARVVLIQYNFPPCLWGF